MRIKRKILKSLLILSKITHGKSYMSLYNKYLKSCGMDISGDIKFIHSSVYLDVAYATRIHVGDLCVMSVNTVVLAHDFSIECGLNSIGKGNPDNEKKIVSDVYIGNNVFIGAGCIVLPGTRIGDNCIIGAGTVCSGIIPDNSVIVGEKWRKLANIQDWILEKQNDLDSISKN